MAAFKTRRRTARTARARRAGLSDNDPGIGPGGRHRPGPASPDQRAFGRATTGWAVAIC